MVGKTAENCGLPTISILTPLYNTPENYLREFLDSFVNRPPPMVSSALRTPPTTPTPRWSVS